MIRSEFYIHSNKYQFFEDKGIDWFIKSFKYKMASDEWKICRLKSHIYHHEAFKHLKLAGKYLKQSLYD
jgi:hypothetical protein